MSQHDYQRWINQLAHQQQAIGVPHQSLTGGAINVTSGTSVATHGIEVSKPKPTPTPNKKLLLLTR